MRLDPACICVLRAFLYITKETNGKRTIVLQIFRKIVYPSKLTDRFLTITN